MLDILAITGPIYITIALGFATTRLGLFSKSDMRVLGKFVVNLALPALLFHALGTACSNSGFVGYPIALLTLGPVAGVMLGLNMMVENLLLHPLAVLGVLLLCEAAGMLPLAPPMRVGVVLTAAMPMLGIYPILAQKHGREGLAAAALLGATVVSFVSIRVLLWVFQQVPGWGR